MQTRIVECEQNGVDWMAALAGCAKKPPLQHLISLTIRAHDAPKLD